MSSVYRLLCMNHDPALALDHTWTSAEEAIAAALEPAIYDWLVEDHGKCDLLVGRYSASLVEVCCPASREHGGHGRHSDSKWIDRDWLVLLHAARTAPADPALREAIDDLARGHSCWTWERVDRLAAELGIEDGGQVDAHVPLSPPSSPRCRCAVTLPQDGPNRLHDAVARILQDAIAYNLRWGLKAVNAFRFNPADYKALHLDEADTSTWTGVLTIIEVDESVPPGRLRVVNTEGGWRHDALPMLEGKASC
jgi:hypothetical protein